MKLLLSVLLFLICTLGHASKTKLYRCQLSDGTVVIQDIQCMATSLKKAPPKRTSAQQKTKPVNKPIKRSNLRVQKRSAKKSITSGSNRSPYFIFGWDSFIPVNWSSQQKSNRYFEETYWSRAILKSPADFRKGVKLRVYKNTMNSGNIGAFAQALNLYHGIRDNNNNSLIDSQFKTHERFKVFNIKYEQPLGIIATTEFYIDEPNNDLFVITVQSLEKELLEQWQLANQIIDNL